MIGVEDLSPSLPGVVVRDLAIRRFEGQAPRTRVTCECCAV